MIGRRLLIALAVLIAVTALAAGVAPEPKPSSDDAAQASPPTDTSGMEVERTLSTRARGSDRRIKATVGDTVRLTVEGDEVDSVELGELEVEAIDPDSPALFELLADEPASYPIRLLDADRTIGTLEISE